MFPRRLVLPPAGSETFFLWGPRQTGKSTLLRKCYPEAFWIDLLDSDEFRRYLERPRVLREELRPGRERFVVIDEVQKLPALLDEVHALHETEGVRFALCGSSARKVRRGGANLLGGRAVRYELFGLVSSEIGQGFDLTEVLNRGYLPAMFSARRPERLWRAYVGDYLREEVAAEGLVRNLPAFSEFLGVAALSDTELVNFTAIAAACGVSRPTVKGYFDILCDTLLARWLPAYRRRPKRRVVASPKLYFADVGVVNTLARRGKLEPRSELYGKAMENWVHHELSAFNAYSERHAPLAYWRLASGTEVDFVVGEAELAIEVKATERVLGRHFAGLRELARDQPAVRRRVVVSLERRARRTEDGIDVLPVARFVRELWDGELF